MEKKIIEFLENSVRHKIQGDGGDFELVAIDEKGLHLNLIAECSRCPITNECYKDWLKQELKEKLDIDIAIITKQKKPYFWG